MLRNPHRSHRSTIPATGLGSILVAVPQLALEADRGVVAEVAVAVGMGEGSFSAMDRRRWADVPRGGMAAGTAGSDPDVSAHDQDGPAAGPTTTAPRGTR